MDSGQIIRLLEAHNFKQLKEELETVHPVDIVDILEELDKKQRRLSQKKRLRKCLRT